MTSIWTPEQSRPAFICRVCRAQFTARERMQWQHHVVRCGEEHHDRLMASREELRRFNAPVDPEWQAYNEDLKARGIDPERQYDRKFKKSARRLRES